MPVEVDDSEDQEGGGDDDVETQEVAAGQQPSQAQCTGPVATKEATPSSGIASKKRAATAASFKKPSQTKQLKIPALLLKSTEEIVWIRHAPGNNQACLGVTMTLH
jgi:hypothetical protein